MIPRRLSMPRSIVGSQPFVAGIWVCVVGAALLGIAKPGANL